jgi:ATP-dependent DNA helicase RecQ
MRDYLEHTGCLMEFLRRELDDPAAAPCGRCARCLGRNLVAVDIDRELVADAVAFLQGQHRAFEARKQWPNGKAIPVDQRSESGSILSHVGDGGWGTLVRDQKVAGAFSTELARAFADLISKQSFDPAVEWVTCVPSVRNPSLVRNLAARVAALLELPFVPVVTKERETPPQTEMNNSAQQYANVEHAFSITAPVPPGPVLLIDDIVDSRWTLTAVAALLCENGSGPVHPTVLAQAKSD